MKFQKSEITIAVMVLMMVVMWAWHGHVGLFGMQHHDAPTSAASPVAPSQIAIAPAEASSAAP